MSFPESKSLVILGDMNADCNYASLNELDSLRYVTQILHGLYQTMLTLHFLQPGVLMIV